MDAAKKYQAILRRADEMRKGMTAAESKLNTALGDPKNELPVFHAQHVIFPYIVDFACLDNQLIIEVDGTTHDFSRDSDALRENELAKLGFKILRFTNGDVIAGLEAVIQKIQFECKFRSTSIKRTAPKPAKKPVKRKMVVPLPRVVYEEPFVDYSRTRASKVRTRKVLDRNSGEVAKVYCAVCNQPIANSDLRVRHRKGQPDEVFWAHKSCTT
jgi:very-short-patch-repair endonuclease